MRIDIWSDIVCPFCYVGKRNLEQALAEFEHRDEVEVVWHSFELDPSATEHPAGSLPEMIAGKYQMSLEQAIASQESLAERAREVGLDFNWRQARYGNTFDAHRVIHYAAEQVWRRRRRRRLSWRTLRRAVRCRITSRFWILLLRLAWIPPRLRRC